jgi:hypothetical protein
MSQFPQGWLDFWHDVGTKKDMGFGVLVTILKHNSYCMVIVCTRRFNIRKS